MATVLTNAVYKPSLLLMGQSNLAEEVMKQRTDRGLTWNTEGLQ